MLADVCDIARLQVTQWVFCPERVNSLSNEEDPIRTMFGLEYILVWAAHNGVEVDFLGYENVDVDGIDED